MEGLHSIAYDKLPRCLPGRPGMLWNGSWRKTLRTCIDCPGALCVLCLSFPVQIKGQTRLGHPSVRKLLQWRPFTPCCAGLFKTSFQGESLLTKEGEGWAPPSVCRPYRGTPQSPRKLGLEAGRHTPSGFFLLALCPWPVLGMHGEWCMAPTWAKCGQVCSQGCFIPALSWKLDPNQVKGNRYFDFLILGYLERNSQITLLS